MTDIVALRCKYCGAPFEREAVESTVPYITCSSCGTTQQRMDAKAYLEEMMVQVKSWISSAIPSGFNMSAAENVDPIARNSIFVRDIRPKVSMELMDYRFGNTSLLGNCLITLPFSRSSGYVPTHTPAKAFEFNARIKSVEPLAVDEAGKALLTEADSLTKSYALMINNMNLLAEDKEGRYVLMSKNFREAASVIRGSKGSETVALRYTALADICDGCQYLLEGKPGDAGSRLRSGKKALEEVRLKAAADPQLGIMVNAVDQEISVSDILISVAGMMETTPGTDGLKILNMIKKVMDTPLAQNQGWGHLLNNRIRYGEIFGQVSAILSAKAGKSQLPISAGAGDYLMPFWEVDLRYSFTTGALWSKKSVEVKEDLLVCADFVTDPTCLNNPASAITDIFKIKPESSILAGIKGNETSISQGQGIGRMQDSVSEGSPGARKVLIPLSTKREAENLVAGYLRQRTASDNKLRLSQPVIRRIIYIPVSLNGGLRLPSDFGTLIPERIGRTDKNTMLYV